MSTSFKVICLLVFLLGCKERTIDKVTLIRAIKCNPKIDSIYVYSDGHTISTQIADTPHSKRYFLISYNYCYKRFDGIYNGCLWFNSDLFPTKREIDSIVYDGLPYKKSCYQSIIITSLFEFKNEQDFDRFGWNYKFDTHVKNKKNCQ